MIAIHSKNSRDTRMKEFRFESTTPLDFGEYRIIIKKNGEFVRCIQYTGMSGTAMMDVAYDLRRQYPKEQGYTVDW